MEHRFCILLAVCLCVLSSCGSPAGRSALPEGPCIPTDSIYCRDPFIVADPGSGLYHLFRSSTTEEGLGGVEVFKSKDLCTWYGPQRVFTAPEDNFINGYVWAPEVHRYKGAWYLFATMNTDRRWADDVEDWPAFTYRGTQIYKSKALDGPFQPLGNKPVTPEGFMALDGTLWVEDGVPYMIFCHEWVQTVDGTVELMPLKADLSSAAGDPVTLFSASQAPWCTPIREWEEADGRTRPAYVTDGTFVYRTKGGELLILWSSFKDGKYSVAIARSESGKIAGPWTLDPEPIFEQDGGHPMVFRDFEGTLRLAFHQPNGGFSHPVILAVEDNGNTLTIKPN